MIKSFHGYIISDFGFRIEKSKKKIRYPNFIPVPCFHHLVVIIHCQGN